MNRTCIALCALAAGAAPLAAQVKVVNMIPPRLSNEAMQNSEPTLAVNRVHPERLAAAMYIVGGNFCSRATEAPIFISSDTGNNWQSVCKIRVDSSSTISPGDVSLRYSVEGDSLYAALLWPNSAPYTMQLYRTDDVLSEKSFLSLWHRDTIDQPVLEVMPWRGKNQIFVGASFKFEPAGTAGVLSGTGLGTESAFWWPVVIEQRPVIQNPAVRLATHDDGTVYAVYYGPRPPDGSLSDVVVVRDDSAATRANPFTALLDTPVNAAGGLCGGHDGLMGIRVATCRIVPFFYGVQPRVGWQRQVSANLSIAINPRNSRDVWVSWADSSFGPSFQQLHLRHSTDGGRTWGTSDVLAVESAMNPAIAVTDSGRVGFLYQQLVKADTGRRWVTQIAVSRDDFATSQTVVLARTSAGTPVPLFQPYIGDYIELHALGDTFMGIFSASNYPDQASFPNGVTYQRQVDWERHRLLDHSRNMEVAVSIDPFFFSVGPAMPPAQKP